MSVEEWAGLACESDMQSRLVQYQPAEDTWHQADGPFDEDRLSTLSASDWSLLIQEVDQAVPSVAALWQDIPPIPHGLRDDIMVSIAAPGGSVGPHLDQYDVFLLQGFGQRTWHIGDKALLKPVLRNDAPMALLADFKPDHSWTLQPGDALYLPPKIPHHGVAVDLCMTYSFGFRQPSGRSLMEALISTCWTEEQADLPLRLEADSEAQALLDGLNREPRSGSLLNSKWLDQLSAKLLDQLKPTPEQVRHVWGRCLTESIRHDPLEPRPGEDCLSYARWVDSVKSQGYRIEVDTKLRMLLEHNHEQTKRLRLQPDTSMCVGSLYVDGTEVRLENAGELAVAQRLTETYRPFSLSLEGLGEHEPQALSFAYRLYLKSYLHFPDEGESLDSENR